MIQRIVFCTIAVVAFGCILVSSTNSSTTSIQKSTSKPMNTSSITSTTIHSSFSVSSSSSVFSPTQSLSSLTTAVSITTTSPLTSSSIMSSSIMSSSIMSSSIMSSAINISSASATVAPASESIRIPKTGPACLQAFLDVTFEVKYESKNKTGGEELDSAEVVLNGNLAKEVHGYCNETTNKAMFEIKWNENGSSPSHTFSMTFQNYSGNPSAWTVNNIRAVFNTSDKYAFKKDAVNESISAKSATSPFGNITHGQAYICNAKETIKMGNVTITFRKLVLQPFSSRNLSTTDGYHCSADKSKDDDDDDNTVPIAVGAALGGLVLIVLVAYIVGRRRSNRGYEQV